MARLTKILEKGKEKLKEGALGCGAVLLYPVIIGALVGVSLFFSDSYNRKENGNLPKPSGVERTIDNEEGDERNKIPKPIGLPDVGGVERLPPVGEPQGSYPETNNSIYLEVPGPEKRKEGIPRNQSIPNYLRQLYELDDQRGYETNIA